MKLSRILAIALVIGAALAAAYYLSLSVSGDNGNRVDFIGPSGTVTTVYVEIADTPQEREMGLMYRTSLDEDRGMLFIFSGESPLSFWMKNTPLPLDIVFVNSRQEIVDIDQNATPYSEAVYTAKGASEYVVEVNGGFCKKHGIAIGDRIKIYLDAP